MTRAVSLRKRALSIAEIHHHAQLHMRAHFKFLSPERQSVVKYIFGRMKKYNGAFFESHRTIAETVGVSVSTVRRAIEIAKKLRIFVVEKCFESTINDKNRQSSNNIIMLPFEETQKVVEKQRTETVAAPVEKKVEKPVAPKLGDDKLYKLFLTFSQKGVTKDMFTRVVEEAKTRNIKTNFVAYVTGCLNNISQRLTPQSYDEHLQLLMNKVCPQFASN
ncbi:MAG: hypothetical protein ACRCWQ_01230 [Bacilli bacterium]